MRYILASLCFLFISCGQNSGRQSLSLDDLKFPDPEKEAIVRNRIQMIVGFDTVWHSSAKQTLFFDEIVKKIGYDSMVKLGGTDTRMYDAFGNRVYYRLQEDWMCGAHPANKNFAFDELGRQTVAKGGNKNDSFCYILDNEHVRQLAIHYISSSDTNDAMIVQDTTFSYFNDTGKLLMEIWQSNFHRQDIEVTFYSYDAAGRLVNKRVKGYFGSYLYKYGVAGKEINYYYNASGLDSMKMDNVMGGNGMHYEDKYLFDKDGIVYMSILDRHFYFDNNNKRVFNDNSVMRPIVLLYKYRKFR